MELIVENIRCFAERQTIPVKPLTLLVGENSAGKSTFLVALSAVSDPIGFPLRPRFNTPPYNLGNYDTIAAYKYGRGVRAKSFTLGYNNDLMDNDDNLQIVATHRDDNGSVEIAHVEVQSQDYQASFTFTDDDEVKLTLIYNEQGKPKTYDFAPTSYAGDAVGYSLSAVLLASRFQLRSSHNATNRQDRKTMWNILYNLADFLLDNPLPQTLSVAPIRTKPKRTYDEVVEEFSPEGEHIPFVLDDVLQDADKRAILENFGRESGLFSHVAVKQWGRKRSDPIQVMVTNAGRPASSAANLTDVGYGVSQALPLVVQSVLAAPKSRLLLQQPEVHLHPRAQAALGTLFVDLLASNDKQFVVETHSDYILDRVRQEVARGKVAANDVSILYFEREKNGTRIYPIDVDNAGNIVNAPPSYRTFFLQEEINLFNRANKNGARK